MTAKKQPAKPAPKRPAGKKPPAKKKPAPKPRAAKQTVEKLLKATPRLGPDSPLTPEEEQFITEYLSNGRNGTAAYRAVHPHVTPASASVLANRLLNRVKVRERIDAERARLIALSEMTRENVVRELTAIITADPADLCQMRRVCCPECWGSQPTGAWTDPNPECEVCSGDGVERPWFADTRKLPDAARALFAGVKVSKEGIQLLMESKSDARDKLYKILGHYEADNKQKQPALTEAFAQFLGQLHTSAESRIPIVPPKPRQKRSPA